MSLAASYIEESQEFLIKLYWQGSWVWRMVRQNQLLHQRTVESDWLTQWELQFLPSSPTELTFLNQLPKIFARVILFMIQKLVQIHSWGTCGQMGDTWPNFISLFISFLETDLEVRSSNIFSRLMAQMMRTCARMCLWGFVWYRYQFKWSNHQKSDLWAWIDFFKPNVSNTATFILFKLLH